MGKGVAIIVTNSNYEASKIFREIMQDKYIGLGISEYDISSLKIDEKISSTTFNNAIKIILNKFAQDGVARLFIDLDQYNSEYGKRKDMTKEDIEAALGYKINIIEKI